MCLITKKKNPRIAKKDIIVWKLLRSDGVSAPYFNFKYEKGKTYKTKFRYVDNSKGISGGYQAFNAKVSNYLDENYEGWDSPYHPVREGLICVSEGFHAFTKKKDANDNILCRSDNRMIVKFIIPKGSEYIKDENGLIVSNQIKML